MSRVSLVLLMATSLVLTVYFGVAAWRASADSQLNITGPIRAAAK
jgi:hypothetical protein